MYSYYKYLHVQILIAMYFMSPWLAITLFVVDTITNKVTYENKNINLRQL
jgi:hypothetical protein